MKINSLQTTGISLFAMMIVSIAGASHVSAMAVDNADQEVDPTPTRAAITQEKTDARATAKDEKAVVLQEKKDARDTMKTEKACARLSTSADKLTERMTVRQEKLEGWQEDQTKKVAQRKELREGQLIEKRAKTDARRAQHYADLVILADTTEKKAALADYSDTVDAAVKARRGVIDDNLTLFWTHSKEVIIEEKKAYAQQYALSAKKVDTAISDAEAACGSEGADAKVIAKELRAQLKAGQTESQSARKDSKDARSQIGEELRARRQAINDTTKEFKEQVRTARADLVKVFGSDVFGDLGDEGEDYDEGIEKNVE